MPTLVSATQPKFCLHLDHHDKNNTCDGMPSSNLLVVGSCGHGNAFNYTHTEGEGGRLRNLNCPNWGAPGACLVSSSSLYDPPALVNDYPRIPVLRWCRVRVSGVSDLIGNRTRT